MRLLTQGLIYMICQQRARDLTTGRVSRRFFEHEKSPPNLGGFNFQESIAFRISAISIGINHAAQTIRERTAVLMILPFVAFRLLLHISRIQSMSHKRIETIPNDADENAV